MTVDVRRISLQFLTLGVLGFSVFVGAESGARVGDFLFDGIPLLSAPSYDDLWVSEAGVRHGRPHGHFKKMRLNNVGMQGPDIEAEARPRPGCHRVVFLGGSETFGRVEVENGDYPSTVRRELGPRRCVEILNASIPGMTASSMISYWRQWVSRVHPDIVFIYPSTHFYLSDRPPGGGTPSRSADTPTAPAPARAAATRLDDFGWLETLRSFDRLKEAVEVPGPIQGLRRRRQLTEDLRGHPDDWLFSTPPVDRAELLEQHLNTLVDDIERTGAQPVLMTHAVRVANPPRPEDHEDLVAMRTWTPRATEATLAAFPYLASQRIRALAQARGIPMLDPAAQLSAKRDNFGDLVHFTRAGTDGIASLIVEWTRARLDADGKTGTR